MSTANSNLDNDPFPVFTPRSNLNTMLQGRSPMQQQQTPQQQQTTGMNLIQQSPYQSSNSANQAARFTTNTNLMRSPNATNSAQIRHDPRLMHTNAQNFVIPNMVQNLTHSMQGVKLQQAQSSTPPPPQQQQQQQQQQIIAPVTSAQQQQLSSTTTVTHAHRKLFPLDAQQQLGHPLQTVSANNLLQNELDVQQQQQQDYSDQTTQNNGRIAPPDLSNVFNLKRSESYFMSDELRNEVLRKNSTMLSFANPDVAMLLPPQVKDYHNLVPLDNQQVNVEHKSRTFGYQTIAYKATHIKTNCVHYLKVLLGYRLTNQRCMEIVEIWKKVQHANIVSLRDVFSTKEFNGEHSIVFVYDYYPALETLQQRLYANQNLNLKGWANPYNLDGSARPYSAGKGKIGLNSSRALGLLPEQVIWEYIIQLTSLIRTIHSANLSCRILSSSRLLIDNKSRLRLSGVGIFDVIDYENSMKNVVNYQQEDLIEFGRLVLAMACNSLFSIQKEHINTSLEIISKNYSTDLRSLILHFITAPIMNIQNNRFSKNINEAMPMIGARFYTCLDNAYTRGDVIENELSKEVENSRLFRLICKLNIVLDRQDSDIAWSETGDRYMLKLFRDYVFHQVNSNGSPWVDVSHIVQCLNKFDYGSSDKICLVSPDGQSIMIVTYAQLKKCFEKVYVELTNSIINI